MTWLCVGILIPASQIPILVIALGIHYSSSSCQKKKTKTKKNLVHAFSKIAESESANHACKSWTVSPENYLYLFVSNTWFGY